MASEQTKTTPDAYDSHTHLVWALCDARNRAYSLRVDVIKRIDEIDRVINEAITLYAGKRP